MAEKKEGSTSVDKRKGKVHFVKTDKGLFPISVLRKAELKHGESQQLREDKKWLAEKGLIPLPFNVRGLLQLQQNCTYFDACVRQIAQDVVGQGWKIIAAKGVDKINENQKKEAEQFLLDPNEDEESIEEIVNRNIIDLGIVGWWGMEVSRAADKKIDGLWHMPAATIRIHREENRFCQVLGIKKRWFKRFGVETEVNQDTGKELKGRSKHPANELIYRRRYSLDNDYYGEPAILPAVGAVRGLIGTRDYNLAFFENYGIPAALVTLEGEWEENSVDDICDFLDVEIKGSENAHKTLVLELPEGGSVVWKPLSIEIKESSFQLYYKDMRNEVLSAYKMPPYRIGIAEVGSLGGSTAKEATPNYIQSVVNPLKIEFAQIITNCILHKGLGLEDVAFEFNELDIRDMNEEVKRWETLFGMAAVNINWIRDQMGEDPVDHGNDYFISTKYQPVELAGAGMPQPVTESEIVDKFKEIEEKIKKEASYENRKI